MNRRLFALALALTIALAAPALGQEAKPEPAANAEQLAKQLSNPIANLVSIPFQFNWDDGVGPNEDTRFLLNIQPVVPFSLGEDWNLIGRLIVPILSQPALVPGGEATFGTSDIVLSAFFSPSKSSGVTWGIGPVFGLPTTTDPTLGTGKWQIGPTAVVLAQNGPLTYGALANHLWSFADTGNAQRSNVSQTFIQPFFAYATKTAVTFTLSSEMTANWKAESGEEWTIPINAQVSKVTRLGPFPFSIGAGAGYYVEKPTGGPDWKLRMVFTVILPRGK